MTATFNAEANQKLARRKTRVARAAVPAVAAFLLASCGGREVVYIEVVSTDPKTAATLQAPRPTTTDVSVSEMLSMDTAEFLALNALTIREQYGYCYSDCTNLEEPEEWIRRAGGGYIENENIASTVAFLMDKPEYEIDDYCELFYSMSDAEIRSSAIQSEIDPKAWIVASYAICDS